MPNSDVVRVDSSVTNDTIFALMGQAGTGKSTFIDIASGQAGPPDGGSLNPETSGIRAVRVPHPKTGLPIALVDTPGFNSIRVQLDAQVLFMIAEWLETTYKGKAKLSGIIYLHSIRDKPGFGRHLMHQDVFERLCGDNAIAKVTLATIKWDEVDPTVGMGKQKELEELYWDKMLELGSGVGRFLGRSDSAWEIIDGIALQTEMFKTKVMLSKTEVGEALYKTLERHVAERKEARKLREESGIGDYPEHVETLTRQYDELREALKITLEKIEELKTPFWGRLMEIFGFR